MLGQAPALVAIVQQCTTVAVDGGHTSSCGTLHRGKVITSAQDTRHQILHPETNHAYHLGFEHLGTSTTAHRRKNFPGSDENVTNHL